jgi:hypothetical protein
LKNYYKNGTEYVLTNKFPILQTQISFKKESKNILAQAKIYHIKTIENMG